MFYCCQETDSGVYTCLASSSSGETSWSGVLTVKGKLSLCDLNTCKWKLYEVSTYNTEMLHVTRKKMSMYMKCCLKKVMLIVTC